MGYGRDMGYKYKMLGIQIPSTTEHQAILTMSNGEFLYPFDYNKTQVSLMVLQVDIQFL